MKAKWFLILSVLVLSLLQACDKDSNGVKVDPQVESSFREKFPDAKYVWWEMKNTYYVADFIQDKCESSAWFDKEGVWCLTETDIRYDNLPESVKKTFKDGEYAGWYIDEIEVIERVNMETLYQLDVEKKDKEYKLSYSQDGILLAVDLDGGNNYKKTLPVSFPVKLQEYLKGNYPEARIVGIEAGKVTTEVKIIDGSTGKTLIFDHHGEWVLTKTKITRSEVPQNVFNVLRASEYASSYLIEDIYQCNAPESDYYYFELKSRLREVDVIITPDGKLDIARISFP